MIPRTLHYCWFGPKEKPDIFHRCLNSWRLHCPDHEIMEWNETTFDVQSNPFTREAYAARKYAFVSDYVRAYALFDRGGVYVDTDVEIKAPLDSLLSNRAFSGFEAPGSPFTAVWGSIAKHSWPGHVLEFYRSRPFSRDEPPNTDWMWRILAEHYAIDPQRDELQHGNDGVVIYPSSTLCLDLPQNLATHHFFGSWLPGHARPWKEHLHQRYYESQFKLRHQLDDDRAFFDYLVKRFGSGRLMSLAFAALLRRLGLRLRRSFGSRLTRS